MKHHVKLTSISTSYKNSETFVPLTLSFIHRNFRSQMYSTVRKERADDFFDTILVGLSRIRRKCRTPYSGRPHADVSQKAYDCECERESGVSERGRKTDTN